MNREFTGRDMTKVLVVGFGIVAAVNFLMANLATHGFGGVVVENSYVASQKFNTWLEEAERSRALGWQADVLRGRDGFLVVNTQGVPRDALVTAGLRRPIGKRETLELDFVPIGNGTFRSDKALGDGRWTMRLHVVSGQDRWAKEVPLP